MKIKNSKLIPNSGFTLIELLVYLAIFAIAAGLLSGILAVFVRVQSQEAAGAELTQQLSFVQSTVQRLVREAVNIENPAGTASNSLVLRMTSPALDPTVISSDSDAIYLQQGRGGAINPLTSDRVKVSQFEVVKYENPGAHAVVQLDFSLTYNSQRAYQQITRGLKTSIGRVTAATFDDSLLPNTAFNSFTIGNQTFPWNSLTLSNLLNLGQLTADPDAGQRNGSIYYNSLDNVFRGFQNEVWANLGGVGWAASGNDIYNTNSGNVGIGTASPGGKLEIKGGHLRINSAASTVSYLTFNVDGAYDNTSIGVAGASNDLVTGTVAGDLAVRAHQSQKLHLGITSVNPALTISVGNVGIGTPAPSATLEVKGTMKIFGAWQSRSNNTVYQAETDGFVIASVSSANGTPRVEGYTDASNPPSILRVIDGVWAGGGSTEAGDISLPVLKGDYWKVVITDSGYPQTNLIWWMPLGG